MAEDSKRPFTGEDTQGGNKIGKINQWYQSRKLK